jgi:hypothetical protein
MCMVKRITLSGLGGGECDGQFGDPSLALVYQPGVILSL